MTCHRRGCTSPGSRPGQLCTAHYAETPHGFVDAAPARAHLAQLRASGNGWDALTKLTGLSLPTLKYLGQWTENGTCTLDTQDRVLAVRVPSGLVAGGALVPAVGTVRRIRGLMWLGWNQPTIAARLGMKAPQEVSSLICRRKWARASTAVKVAGLFDELQWQVGPYPYPARFARQRGWFPPAAWDDIDDPDCQPDLGQETVVRFPERFLELREHCEMSLPEIAERMGVDTESVKQQLRRYRMKEAS